jgi:hypothetical protein
MVDSVEHAACSSDPQPKSVTKNSHSKPRPEQYALKRKELDQTAARVLAKPSPDEEPSSMTTLKREHALEAEEALSEDLLRYKAQWVAVVDLLAAAA